MPGIPGVVQNMMAYLEALNRVQPKSEAEAQGVEMAKQDLLSQMESRMEYGLREPGEPLPEQGFSGQIGNPAPIPAPYHGEYDMPGNFEREQRMSNSLANDAALRTALSTKYKYDPEVGVPVSFAKMNWAHLVNSGLNPGWDTVYLEGPPDWRNQIRYPNDPRKWGPGNSKVFSEKDIMGHGKMLARASKLGTSSLKNWMRVMDRMYRNRPHSKKRLMELIGG